MFGSIGMGEMIIIFIIALIIFGPRKLPELGRALGKGINEFKKASNELRTTIEDEIKADSQRTADSSTTTPAATAEASEPKILPPAEPGAPASPAEPAAPESAAAEPAAPRTEHGA